MVVPILFDCFNLSVTNLIKLCSVSHRQPFLSALITTSDTAPPTITPSRSSSRSCTCGSSTGQPSARLAARAAGTRVAWSPRRSTETEAAAVGLAPPRGRVRAGLEAAGGPLGPLGQTPWRPRRCPLVHAPPSATAEAELIEYQPRNRRKSAANDVHCAGGDHRSLKTRGPQE